MNGKKMSFRKLIVLEDDISLFFAEDDFCFKDCMADALIQHENIDLLVAFL